MKIAIILILLSCHLKSEENGRVSFEEAGKIWRETTERGILPPEFQFVRDHIGYYEAVVSYFRDGPGIFNVAPDVKTAALDRIFYYSIQDLGYETMDSELLVFRLALDTGNERQIRTVEKLIRERYAARLIRGSTFVIEKLKEENTSDKQIDYFSQGLRFAVKKIKAHSEWRASDANKDWMQNRSRAGQDKILNEGIKSIEEYLESVEK